MPSQFSALGFQVSSGEDLAALASHVADRADSIKVEGGQYLRWAPPSGEQLWLQLKPNGDAMGMTPHFAGRSAVRAGLEARVARPSHTPLEGTFLAWANPPAGAAVGGDYPFVFDCPDAAVHHDLALPAEVVVQVAAFAQQAAVHASAAAYEAEQAAQGLSFGARSFIPSGLVSPDGQPLDPPEPHALIAGMVVESAELHNAVTGDGFYWVLVDSLGGTFDLVIDPSLLPALPQPGNVVSGWFWLSGRLRAAEAPAKPGWLDRLRGR